MEGSTICFRGPEAIMHQRMTSDLHQGRVLSFIMLYTVLATLKVVITEAILMFVVLGRGVIDKYVQFEQMEMTMTSRCKRTKRNDSMAPSNLSTNCQMYPETPADTNYLINYVLYNLVNTCILTARPSLVLSERYISAYMVRSPTPLPMSLSPYHPSTQHTSSRPSVRPLS